MSMDKYSRIRRFRNVLKLREEGMSFEAIASRFGLSRQRMWQVHAEAVKWSERPKKVTKAELKARAKLEAASKQVDENGQPIQEGEGKPKRRRFTGFGRFRDLQPEKRRRKR